MSLEWADYVGVRGEVDSRACKLDVSRVRSSDGGRLVIRSSTSPKGADLLEIPAHQGPALRDILGAMYPKGRGE